ncbi:hypothetical protein N0V83_002477 [Neocucurbitaria cava]|uniref:Uncharacterized protein n=1 Tax=Neocucurbitaria cava TaxID=798079 RepID=A0A9W8YH30_9PLEO|nr:hypothetical protein N0V83_002477 [Neocucurbitaria cava]
MVAQKNWRDNYPNYDKAMESIKNGGPPLFKPGDIPSDVQQAEKWSPPKPASYATFTPQSDSAPSDPPKGAPKSLQIVYETFVSEGAESWQKWHFFEGVPRQAVDTCSDKVLFSVDNAPPPNGYDPPWINVKNHSFRSSGYAEDCRFDGLDGKGPSGDVGWLYCPERPAIMCVEDAKKSGGKDAWKNCDKGLWTRDRIPVAYCDWE